MPASCDDLRGYTRPKAYTHNHKPLLQHLDTRIIMILRDNVKAIMWWWNNEAVGRLTLDSVRFLGTSFMSSFKSVGSGMPKEKPPYLK